MKTARECGVGSTWTIFKGGGMKRARLRSVINGHVCEEDAIISTADEWPSLVRQDPSLASWRLATHADRTVIALEPLADVLARVFPAPVGCGLPAPERARRGPLD